MSENMNATIVLSINDIYENERYVLVEFVEAKNNKIFKSLEKGIKNKDGDIVEFVPIRLSKDTYKNLNNTCQ